MGAEYLERPAPPLFEVRTAIEIHGPPEEVWRQVVAFSELPEPREWLFRAGIAYPVRATIQGHGPGAVRHCVFSTGAFLEPIEVWDEPRRLKFSVTSNPPPMQEWTPYSELHPRHLDGFLVSRRGQFLQTPLPDGSTRLEGTTWYHHHMWPAGSWRMWSDGIIHPPHSPAGAPAHPATGGAALPALSALSALSRPIAKAPRLSYNRRQRGTIMSTQEGRRSPRLRHNLDVQVIGQTVGSTAQVAASAQTLVVNEHGALIRTRLPFQEGSVLEILNEKTLEKAPFRVVRVKAVTEKGPYEVAVESQTGRMPDFWSHWKKASP